MRHTLRLETSGLLKVFQRSGAALALCGGLGMGWAMAQDAPPMSLNSGTLAQSMPFVGTQSPLPAGPPAARVGPPQMLAPGGTRANPGDPHAILPQPPPGKAAIGMSARFGAADPLVPRGLVWRVFADRPEASGAYPLVAEAAEPAPVFFLSPGGYVVHVSYGLASVARRIAVGEDSRREQITMSAGAVQLRSDVNDKAIPLEKVSYDIFEGSFLQGRASSRPFYRGASSGEMIILPAGDYYVVSTYGDGNAVIQADIAVASGKVTDATLHHRAGEIVLRLVQAKGGTPLPNTQWSVLSPGGDAIKESAAAVPSLVLAEGQYVAIARYEGKTYSKEFEVESGKDRPVELLVGEQFTPSTAPAAGGEDGSGDSDMGISAEGSGD